MITPAKRRVLVVDDYASVRQLLLCSVREIGFDAEAASDGLSALGKLHDLAFDLVISDWNMEPMSGLTFLKEARADSRLRDIPFILVTARNALDGIVEAKKFGISGYILKPFAIETLRAKIEAVLGPASGADEPHPARAPKAGAGCQRAEAS